MRPNHRDMLIAYWMLFDEFPSDEHAVADNPSEESAEPVESAESSDRSR